MRRRVCLRGRHGHDRFAFPHSRASACEGSARSRYWRGQRRGLHRGNMDSRVAARIAVGSRHRERNAHSPWRCAGIERCCRKPWPEADRCSPAASKRPHRNGTQAQRQAITHRRHRLRSWKKVRRARARPCFWQARNRRRFSCYRSDRYSYCRERNSDRFGRGGFRRWGRGDAEP